jgi:hypothetical protein
MHVTSLLYNFNSVPVNQKFGNTNYIHKKPMKPIAIEHYDGGYCKSL